MNSFKKIITPITLSVTASVAFSGQVTLKDSATFTEGLNINEAPYPGIEYERESTTVKKSDFTTISVTPDGKQVRTTLSKKDFKLFKNAIKQLEAAGLTSEYFSILGNTSPANNNVTPPLDASLLTSEGISTESVHGADGRVRVTNTVQNPHYYNGRIAVGCTGTLIGPRHVLTAGHCVSPGNGTWYSNLDFTVAQNGSYKPWGSENWSTAITTSGWFNNANGSIDYGMIVLAAPPHGGWSGFGTYNSNGTYNITGYPGDKPFGQMWGMSGSTSSDSDDIFYALDTAGGQSGSGIKDGNHYVRGIHTNGGYSLNSGTRITLGVYNRIINWRNSY